MSGAQGVVQQRKGWLRDRSPTTRGSSGLIVTLVCLQSRKKVRPTHQINQCQGGRIREDKATPNNVQSILFPPVCLCTSQAVLSRGASPPPWLHTRTRVSPDEGRRSGGSGCCRTSPAGSDPPRRRRGSATEPAARRGKHEGSAGGGHRHRSAFNHDCYSRNGYYSQ